MPFCHGKSEGHVPGENSARDSGGALVRTAKGDYIRPERRVKATALCGADGAWEIPSEAHSQDIAVGEIIARGMTSQESHFVNDRERRAARKRVGPQYNGDARVE